MLLPAKHALCFKDPATTEIYTLSLHDALPICAPSSSTGVGPTRPVAVGRVSERTAARTPFAASASASPRSEEHTSELQSRQYLVCRLLLEKKLQIAKSHV